MIKRILHSWGYKWNGEPSQWIYFLLYWIKALWQNFEQYSLLFFIKIYSHVLLRKWKGGSFPGELSVNFLTFFLLFSMRLFEFINRNGSRPVYEKHQKSADDRCSLEKIIFFEVPHYWLIRLRNKCLTFIIWLKLYQDSRAMWNSKTFLAVP